MYDAIANVINVGGILLWVWACIVYAMSVVVFRSW